MYQPPAPRLSTPSPLLSLLPFLCPAGIITAWRWAEVNSVMAFYKLLIQHSWSAILRHTIPFSNTCCCWRVINWHWFLPFSYFSYFTWPLSTQNILTLISLHVVALVDIFMWLVLVLLLCCSRFSYFISLFSHPFTHMHVHRGQFSIPYIFPSFDVQVYCSVSRVKWETRTKYFVSSAMSASGCSTIDSSTTKIRLISTASSVRWPVRTQSLCKMHKLLVSFYSFLHSVHIFISWRLPLFLTLILHSRQVF